MDMGALMAYYEEYANVIRGNDPFSLYEEYARMESVRSFIDYLAIKHCGDVY